MQCHLMCSFRVNTSKGLFSTFLTSNPGSKNGAVLECYCKLCSEDLTVLNESYIIKLPGANISE